MNAVGERGAASDEISFAGEKIRAARDCPPRCGGDALPKRRRVVLL
jgi:hypothetical protein